VANSFNRLDGYKDEVFKRGRVDGDFIFLSDEDFKYIKENYSPKPPQKKQEDTQYPSIKTMAKTAASSTANWIKSGAKIVDEETLNKRKEVCRTCEFWNSEALGGTGRCKKCGCSTWAKLRMATEKCPIGKW
jgi:hypothetical protein